jgi:AcrR family transcriptional regulator
VGSKERIEREKEHRREAIVRAAERLFLKKGLNGTTMDEIAKKCELSKGALYLYFAKKEQLFHAIVHRALAAMYGLMRQMQEGVTDHVERLRMVGEAYFRFYETHPDYFRILSRTFEFDHPENYSDEEVIRIRELHSQIWGLMNGIIRDGVEDGTFRKETDPVEISLSLYAITTMVLQIMDHYQRNKPEMKEWADDIFHGLDFRAMYANNGRRIVMSILTDPKKYQHLI